MGVSRKISASDRICTVDISLSCQSPDTLTLVNIYCPSADHNEAEYAQCLIAGDFNAHLGTLAGPRGTGTPNSRGLLSLSKFLFIRAEYEAYEYTICIYYVRVYRYVGVCACMLTSDCESPEVATRWVRTLQLIQNAPLQS